MPPWRESYQKAQEATNWRIEKSLVDGRQPERLRLLLEETTLLFGYFFQQAVEEATPSISANWSLRRM
jgi:hypothetical protein